MTRSLGKQTLAEFYECGSDILNNSELLEKIMLKATETAGASVINSFFHKFSPHGVTGIVIISESHLSIHTWPEYNFAAVDLFTCGNIIDNIQAMDYIKEHIHSGYYSITEITRGILNVNDLKHKDPRFRPE